MKVLVVTLPLREAPSMMPPLGALSVINYLRKSGHQDVEFYDIDGLRPRYEDVIDHIVSLKPDIFGISATVSTAYSYTKRLTLDLKARLPNLFVVVGGNMAAASEILLRRAGADVCVLGEGEIVFKNVVERAATTRNPADFIDIPGLMVVGPKGTLVNTGYEVPLPNDQIWDIDWTDVEKSGRVDLLFPKAVVDGLPARLFRHDPRAYEPHRANKRWGCLTIAKGCVARCTFCHRWDKGIRHIPVDEVLRRLDVMVERFDVGFVATIAESFGNDKRWLDEFLRRIEPYDLLWGTAGVRTATLTPEWIARMKQAGFCRIACGNESGSERMLSVMEKKLDIKDNYNAAKWIIEAKMGGALQFVLGMPGEDSETVGETIDYINFATTIQPEQNPTEISVNYAQALPGTPLYEYARRVGLIKPGLDGEEEYLTLISDRDAHDAETALNFTEYPRLIWLSWRPRISIEVNRNFIRTYGYARYVETLLRDMDFLGGTKGQGQSKLSKMVGPLLPHLERGERPPFTQFLRIVARGQSGLAIVFFPEILYSLRRLLWLMVLLHETRTGGLRHGLTLLGEMLVKVPKMLWKKKFPHGYRSLRKIVDQDFTPAEGDAPEMEPLRKGR